MLLQQNEIEEFDDDGIINYQNRNIISHFDSM